MNKLQIYLNSVIDWKKNKKTMKKISLKQWLKQRIWKSSYQINKQFPSKHKQIINTK